jgi:hypothetical protein
MTLVSDDYIALETPSLGTGFYSNLWLHPDDAETLKGSLGSFVHHDLEPKSCVKLSPERMTHKVAVSTILLPRKGSAQLTPADPSTALQVLQQRSLTGDFVSQFKTLAEAATCYELGLDDRENLADLVFRAGSHFQLE